MEGERSSRKFRAGLFVPLLAFGIASAISSTPAIGAEGTLLSQAAGSGTNLPPGYVHNDTCISCHDVQVKSFRKTMMGHIMMGRPRDEQEGLACQACHGPGRQHLRHPSKPSPGFVSFR